MERLPSPSNIDHRPPRRRAAGFTLIEAALTTVIVGTGVLAIVAAQQAYHQKNGWAQRTGTAMLLANEIREMTWAMPLSDPQGAEVVGAEETTLALYDDLLDLAGTQSGAGDWSGTTFSPPRNALRGQIIGMDGWSQHVQVASVQPNDISSTLTDYIVLGSTDMMRVSVTVSYQDPNEDDPEAITTLTWVVPKR